MEPDTIGISFGNDGFESTMRLLEHFDIASDIHARTRHAQSGRTHSPRAQSGRTHSPRAQSGRTHSPCEQFLDDAMEQEPSRRARPHGYGHSSPDGVPRIAIKPNLVVSSPSRDGATTDPRIVEAIVAYLLDNGFDDIVIMESAWLGDDTERAFRICGYTEISKKYGIPLLDLKSDPARKV